MLIVFNEFGNYLFYGTNDHVVGDLVDGSIGIAVYRDDDARILHTSNVLNLSGDTTGDVHLGVNSDPDAPINRIADYVIVGTVEEVVPKLIKYYKQNSK